MKRNEHKRVKHGEMPGQIHRSHIIKMREKKSDIEIFPWYWVTKKQIDALNRYMKEKSKTVQRRRDKRRIEEGILE